MASISGASRRHRVIVKVDHRVEIVKMDVADCEPHGSKVTGNRKACVCVCCHI